jgi:hypothetical protein
VSSLATASGIYASVDIEVSRFADYSKPFLMECVIKEVSVSCSMQSRSYFTTDSQSVLVSSTLLDLRLEITSCLVSVGRPL